jgi:hypothetical protein
LLPVVDGLEQEHEGHVTFRRYSERSPEGMAVLRRFRMPGHGFVAVDARGEPVWKSIGHNATRQQLDAAVRLALERS